MRSWLENSILIDMKRILLLHRYLILMDVFAMYFTTDLRLFFSGVYPIDGEVYSRVAADVAVCAQLHPLSTQVRI